MDDSCKCCQGIEPLTPMAIANRPGLPALRYRAGSHAAFLETMLAQLSSSDYLALAGLTTRERSDPAIALLDAWAVVADVLTFYQERIANEGYLRTAAERRSILELARLVGYALRPGVAASVYLAFTLDENAKEAVTIPQGARVQSVPGPGELPQTFETSEEFKARREWNALKPRLTQPQAISSTTDTIYIQGINANLKPNDPLLFVFSSSSSVVRRVFRVETDAKANRTKVVLTIKGEIDLDLDGLIGSIQPGQIPEEEGPYSVVIGDRAATRDIQQAVQGIVQRLQDQTQSPDALIRVINQQIPLLEQTIRIYKALNFDILAAWATRVLQQLKSIVRQLRMRPPGKTPPATPVDPGIIAEVRKLLEETHHSTKPFGKEIGDEETKSIKKSLKELLDALENNQINDADKMLAAQAALLRLNQYSYVFEVLGFTALVGWVNKLRKLLAAAVVPPTANGESEPPKSRISPLPALVRPLLKLPSVQPISALYLKRNVDQLLSAKMDTSPQLLVTMLPRLAGSLYQAWRNAPVVKPGAATIYALRSTAAVFGYNAPLKIVLNPNDGPSKDQISYIAEPDGDWSPSGEEEDTIFLDNAYDAIVPGSYIVIQKSGGSEEPHAYSVEQVSIHPRTAYGISGKTTEIQLPEAWWHPAAGDAGEDGFKRVVRGTVVYAQSEKLVPAEEPIESPLGPDPDDPQAAKRVELDCLYDGLASGQWLIVSGERTGIAGVKDAELVMLAQAEQGVNEMLPSDKPHTTLILANEGLSFNYKRDTVIIYANVVKATHGETRAEVLGSGDGSKALQSFTLKQPPLTYVAAPIAAGAESTLQVRVNEVKWHEADTLAGLSAGDRKFITKTDDDGKTAVTFGNGQEGARLPTGVENIRAVYRSGIGKAGNVRAGQLSLLMTRPLGVKEVVNPLAASGGADKESRDMARGNAPLAVKALDRLVSVQDYADFARTYAGIGKASAIQLSGGHRELVHLTIAGVDDIPIEEHSDLYRNLVQALRRYGDPYQPFQVKVRELLLLIVEAGVHLLVDYLWEAVEPKIRSALLDAFSFERRELGQDVFYSEVVSVIQAVPGVAYVDLDTLDAASQDDVLAFLAQTEYPNLIAFLKSEREKLTMVAEEQPRKRIPAHLARSDVSRPDGIAPAQLVFVSSNVPDTLILKEKPL